ncbi:MAG: type II/IV secretion system protein [Candidatus Pacebacteria bacterium]|nr:type II/IV secretion system protein [Candidatus Paceibacterota bacterium]
MNFLETLVKQGVITADDVTYIQEESVSSGRTVEDILREKGITAGVIAHAKSELLHIPSMSLEDREVPFEVLKYIPEESAIHYKIIPINVKDGVLEVGVVDPDNIEARDALNFIASKVNMPFKIYIVSEDDFQKVLATYKGLTGEVTKALGDLESEFTPGNVEVSRDDELVTKTDASGQVNIVEDAPVTKIVATTLRYAIEGEASDIHIEPLREKVRIRFRVDGVLNTSLALPLKVHDAVVARIKVLCNMKLDEKRKPQDGRFSARIDGRKIDFRVSTFPTYFGEKVVMRILDQQKGVQPIDKLGMSARDLDMIQRALKRPYGLILISGPTGSGKTTTLYSMINAIDRETQNVLSLEDPVEYNIEGMSQSQVRPEIGYTFASGLRTTLRQDPDVIMVGEIRDKETAQLAIQAALTGHLVLSTIHTNSSIGIIPRLIDMGIDPFLIAPTLVLGMAQRLVGKAYAPAVKAVPVEDSLKMFIEKQFEDMPQEFKNKLPPINEIYEISPTADCPKGTKGRQAVFEVFEMDKDFEKVILKDPTEPTIYALLRSKGFTTMKDDAIIKSLTKVIPFEEVSTV